MCKLSNILNIGRISFHEHVDKLSPIYKYNCAQIGESYSYGYLLFSSG